MVLICAANETIARSIGRDVMLAGRPRLYATTMDRALEMTTQHRPSVVLVDVKLGGSRVRAVEYIPWLLRASPLSRVVALTYSPSVAELKELVELGAYTYVDLEGNDRDLKIRTAVFQGARKATSGDGARRRKRGARVVN